MKPTYEQFRDLVKTAFAKYMPDLSDEQREEYLTGEEAARVIKNEYDRSSDQFDRGEIDEKIFRNGSVSAAASTLDLLY